MMTLAPLPIYPSTRARKGFSASQLAQFHTNLANALAHIIELPPGKRDTPSTRAFVSTYASDGARQVLETLIWEDASPVKHDDRLCQLVLLLAEKIASTAPGLDLKTILDLCVACPSRITRLRAILCGALHGTPDLPAAFASHVVPAFTTMLSPSQSAGLYGLRKTVRCLTSLLRPSPPSLVRSFAHSRDFILALARAYDDGLTTISRAYGGMRTDAARELDHWEHLWLNTKVDMIDVFHLIVTTMVHDISLASGTQLAAEADRTFGIVSALVDMVPPSATAGPAEAVPFLDRSLVADYQYAYDLSKTLSSALRHASHEDARMQRLEVVLRSLDTTPSGTDARDPGALRPILHSRGSAHKVIRPAATDKGKAKATAPEPTPPHDDLDVQVTQVLDVLPDHSPEYIRKLLTHPSFPFCGSAENVIDALLTGTAPEETALVDTLTGSFVVPKEEAPIERRNIFDEDLMDLSRVHVGKKTQDIVSLTRDSAETQRMKADILRLAEAMSNDSDEEESGTRGLDVMDLDDDFDEAGAGAVRVQGDGEDSGDEEVDEERLDSKPETILELAYLRDSKLFDRDAQTRRSKSRADLKEQTGWTDEQIEGWKIMLERNPKKDHILQKHEFSGNRTLDTSIAGGTKGEPPGGQRGRGRGRASGSRGRGQGRGHGRGRGEGGGSGRGEKNDEILRERAFKEKHKSSYRKRGHDKKMIKTGAGPSA